MYFSTSAFKSMISWLYTGCMRGRISVTGQSAGFCAVRAPGRHCRGRPDASPTHSPDSSPSSPCPERTEKVCGSSCTAQTGSHAVSSGSNAGPCAILHGCSLSPAARVVYTVAHVASCDRSRCAMENT